MKRNLYLIFYYIFRYPYYKMIFGKIGRKTKLKSPIISGAANIYIGNDVFIRKCTWLATDTEATNTKTCSLVINDGSYIGNFCHIYATNKIEIGKKVLIADRVYISDNLHSYEDINTAIIDQPIKQLKVVLIKDGAWIGENACIVGACVGKNSVVGANSVVTKDIPDYCVAVGAPAKIIKRYNFDLNIWSKTDGAGNFI
jgi:acetyltransferase-like isoleucine patch superfamily enzyme